MHAEMRRVRSCQHGLDFYRETMLRAGLRNHAGPIRRSGVRQRFSWPTSLLQRIYQAVSRIPSAVCVLKKCDFLHFGSTREILASGRQIFQQQQQRLGQQEACLSINNQFADHGGGARRRGLDRGLPSA